MENFTPYDKPVLLRQVALGDEKAFRMLFDEYKDRFYSVSLKMTGNSDLAQEMVQDIFVKIWKNRATLPDIQNPDAYLLTALYRQIFKYYKKLALERKLLRVIAESPAFQNITDETVLARESERLINEAISKLPQQRQLVFRLSKQDGLTRDQVAEKLNISPHTVRNHMAEAIKFIRAYLKHAAFIGMMIWLIIC